MKKTKLLIIEDEAAIRDLIQFSLPTAEFDFTGAEDAKQALELLHNTTPDLIILDWMLPDKSGIDFLKSLKKSNNFNDIPVIMLTARAEEENKIRGLQTGADDYVTKPFSPAELIARIQAVLRRGTVMSPDGLITVDQLTLNTKTNTVTIDNAEIDLTPIEYKLLHFFIKHPKRVYSREQLIDHIWGRTTFIDDRSVDVQIRRLRNKLKPFGYHHTIKTIRGSGYQFTGNNND